jgi:hypothetical protein
VEPTRIELVAPIVQPIESNGVVDRDDSPLAFSLAQEIQNAPSLAHMKPLPIDPNLAELLNLWPLLTETGRKFLLDTAKMLQGGSNG